MIYHLILTIYGNFFIMNLYTSDFFGVVNCIIFFFILNKIFIYFLESCFSFMKINLIQTITCFKSCMNTKPPNKLINTHV